METAPDVGKQTRGTRMLMDREDEHRIEIAIFWEMVHVVTNLSLDKLFSSYPVSSTITSSY